MSKLYKKSIFNKKDQKGPKIYQDLIKYNFGIFRGAV